MDLNMKYTIWIIYIINVQNVKKYNVPSGKVVVVGNDYTVDILPAIRLGFKTVFIKDGKSFGFENKVSDCYQALSLINKLINVKT